MESATTPTTPSPGSAEGGKGAKKRSGIPMRAAAGAVAGRSQPQQPQPELRRVVAEDGRDSGLSSESTTPTNGSPPPRQAAAATPKQPLIQPLPPGIPRQIPRRKMVDIIAASKARLQLAEERLNNRTRLLHNRSSTDSPKSLESTRGRQVYSPLRTPRNVQSPSLDSGDEGSLKIERGTYNYMFQDIVSIKTMLLKLKRVLQETDTLNPFENSLKNGLLYSLNDSSATEEGSLNEGSVVEELADLRRQVVYLQGQVDEKDRTIQNLQAQLTKYQNHGGPGQPTEPSALLSNGTHQAREMLNAATQTDKLRPLSIGSSILQGLSEDNGTGSLVSSSDSWASSSTEQRQQSRLAGKEPSPSASSYCCSSISSGSSVSLGGAERPSPRRASRLRPPSSLQQQQQQQRQQSASPEAQARAPRKLAAPTLIPRAARAVSASGRTSTGSS